MTNPALASVLREGDIYRWRWADPKRDAESGSWGSYHCKSQIAVVKNGLLFDTFWHGPEHTLDAETVILTHWANTADLIEIRAYDILYYRREDIVDLRHSNNSLGPIYLRKGAERDAATMLELIQERLAESHGEIERARDRIKRLSEDAAKIHAGKINEVYL